MSKSKETAYMGIDPGINGAISIIYHRQLIIHSLTNKLPREVWNCLNYYIGLCEIEGISLRAALERQTPRPTRWYDKRTGQWSQSILRSTVILYGHYTQLVGMLTAGGVEFEEVLPQDWHKALEISPREDREKDGAWKRRLRDTAVASLSGIVDGVGGGPLRIPVTVADSVLLALYCRKGGE